MQCEVQLLLQSCSVPELLREHITIFDFPGRVQTPPPLGPPMWCLSLAGPTLGQLKISVAVNFTEASLCNSICHSTLTLLIFNLMEATNNTGIC